MEGSQSLRIPRPEAVELKQAWRLFGGWDFSGVRCGIYGFGVQRLKLLSFGF